MYLWYFFLFMIFIEQFLGFLSILLIHNVERFNHMANSTLMVCCHVVNYLQG
jgi:hypothetical protein